jgi:transposase
MKTRKKYPKEFKLDAISLVLDQEYTKAESACSLEINPTLIACWIKEHQADDSGQAFRGNGKLTPEQAEIRRLKEENKRLKMEKDVLKKAMVFFAKETK